MIFAHEIVSSTGVAVAHHKMARVELSGDLLDVMIGIDSWPTERTCLDGMPPAARWHVRVPSSTLRIGADLITALVDAVLATDDFSGATTIKDNALAIDTLRLRKWAEVKAERRRREAGTFTCAGLTFDCNTSAIAGATLAAVVAKMTGTTWSQSWVLADNSLTVLNADQMIAVGQSCKSYIGGLWATSQALRNQINSATSAEQLDLISWPS